MILYIQGMERVTEFIMNSDEKQATLAAIKPKWEN